jgi:predicted KAP-like P-loop ATPase
MDISGKDKNDKVTIVRFNPWGYTDGTQLIQQFFSVLSSEIQSDTRGNKRKAIGEALEKYSFLLNSLKYIPVVVLF